MSSSNRVDHLIEKMRNGHRASLSRIVSKVENQDADAVFLLKKLFSLTGKAQIWGVTGPPGAGKSTLVNQMIKDLRSSHLKVAVIAVDPSSPFTGGAVLGDRIRMHQHYEDEGVYIRSLGTRGGRGGLSRATREVASVLDAAGFDVILIETVGVGQTELDILKIAHSLTVCMVPEGGDSIQFMKAGMMEAADVFLVNKSDRPGADKMSGELTRLCQEEPIEGWTVPVLKTQGIEGVGVSEWRQALSEHQDHLKTSSQGQDRLEARLRDEVVEIIEEKTKHQLVSLFQKKQGKVWLKQLLSREIDPYSLAEQILTAKQNT